MFEFTNNWFQTGAQGVWDQILTNFSPLKILEIGSYEGASACYLINKLANLHDIELHCVDTWEGGIEHQVGGTYQINMNEVENRFTNNIEFARNQVKFNVDLHIHKSNSDQALIELLAKGRVNYFDFIYIDGSHMAPDVLSDAILAFKLLKNLGLMIFDDYIWAEQLPTGIDLIRCPKPAIDAFTNIYCRKISIISAHLSQLYVQKISN